MKVHRLLLLVILLLLLSGSFVDTGPVELDTKQRRPESSFQQS